MAESEFYVNSMRFMVDSIHCLHLLDELLYNVLIQIKSPGMGKETYVMKKKLVGLMLSSMLALSLTACGGEEAAQDTAASQVEVSAPSDTVTEAVDTESTDSTGVLYGLAMEEIPDLADTTWDFAGGMIDGEEISQEDYETTLETTYGGQLSFVFDGNGNAQMVQGGGSMNGTYEVRDDGLVAVVFDNNGSDLIYACFFTDMDGLTMIALSDDTGNNGVYFVQR